MRVPILVLAFIVGPIRIEIDPVTKQQVLTHLQKYSRCGILITWPFCIHMWYFWKKQTGSDETGWMPGTEQGLYIRTPGFRYDAELGMKFTRGYIGLNWD